MASRGYAGNYEVKVDRCIFCESKGPLTEEHIFPQWVKRATDYESDGSRSKLIAPGGYKVSVAHVNHADRTLKVLCAKCNNEWGSDIQNEASKILKSVINGDWGKLTGKTREKIARWVACFVMVRDFLHAETQSIPQTQRKDFRVNNKIPECFHIWMALFSGDNKNLFTQQRSYGFLPEGPGGKTEKIYFTKFVLQKVVFFVFGGSSTELFWTEGVEFFSMEKFIERVGFVRLWPCLDDQSLSANGSIEEKDLESLVPSVADALLNPLLWMHRENLMLPSVSKVIETPHFFK